MSRLFAFEGPDEVGKTAISRGVERALRNSGVRCERLSFPGHEPGSLGALVRDLHHNLVPAVESVHPTALQLMHVAAHIDAIERRVLPLLIDSTTVLLDRFWWSTYVYAHKSGVPASQIRTMLDVETASWGDIVPKIVFLVQRDSPSVDRTLVKTYETLAAAEHRSTVLYLDNNRDILLSVQDAVEAICDAQPKRTAD